LDAVRKREGEGKRETDSDRQIYRQTKRERKRERGRERQCDRHHNTSGNISTDKKP
jgi:hypothetical protein